MECQRGQAILDCICMDPKLLEGIGAVQQLSEARTLEKPPPFVLTLQARFQHLTGKLFLELAADDDDGLSEQAEKVDTTIHPNGFQFGRTVTVANPMHGGGAMAKKQPITV